ncbi:MAG: transposase, partial [Pseudomonadota bacterium]
MRTKAPRRSRGRTLRYSDMAVETVLLLAAAFELPLRQAEGFARSILALMDLDLPVQDHTTLARRRPDPFRERSLSAIASNRRPGGGRRLRRRAHVGCHSKRTARRVSTKDCSPGKRSPGSFSDPAHSRPRGPRSRHLERPMPARSASATSLKSPPTAASPVRAAPDTENAHSQRPPSPASQAAAAPRSEPAHTAPNARRS